MDHQTFMQVLHGTHQRLLELTASKGEEYKAASDDQLANFRRVAERTGVQPLTALMTFMNKHYDSLCEYVRREQLGMDKIESEPIAGRIDDLILYAILFKAMVMDQRGVPGDADLPCATTINAPDLGDLIHTGPVRHNAVRTAGAGDPAPWGDRSDRATIAALTEQVVRWASSAFPERSIDTVRLKLTTQEIPELLVAIGLKHWDHAGEEIADVLILLLDLCAMLKIDLARAIQHKMLVNRGRRWTIGPDGVSQHLPEKRRR